MNVPEVSNSDLKPLPIPDLQTQLESLLDSAWDAEANWRFDDRIDLAQGVRRNPSRRPNALD